MKYLRLLTIVTILSVINSAIFSNGVVAQTTQGSRTETISLSYSFSPEALSLDEFQGFDRVTLAENGFICKEGEPFLPVKNIRLALPLGMEASHLIVMTSGEVRFDLQRSLLPGTRPLTGNSAPQELPDFIQGPVYEMDASYPGMTAELIRVGSISGFPMAQITIYPVQYNPVQHEMLLYEKIDLQLKLKPSSNPDLVKWTRGSNGDDSLRRMVQSLVDNPEAVPFPEKRSKDGAALQAYPVEYLIITDAAFVTEFQRLADWKIKKGIWTEIITVADIYQNYSGIDPQDQIRNCIKAYKDQYGQDFEYVLLGGDKDIIGCRCPFVNVTVTNPTVPESVYKYPPSDLYYSALEGTWDADGDGLYGEYPDDNYAGYLDWGSDVFLGRAPVDTVDQARIFVDKVLLYEGADIALPLDYQKNLYFFSANMDSTTSCSVLKNQIDVNYVNFGGNTFFNVTKHHSMSNQTIANWLNLVGNVGSNVINHAGCGWID
ncbi:MAG: C25 family cysteine peptidase, partial [Planctomycetota bacterium]